MTNIINNYNDTINYVNNHNTPATTPTNKSVRGSSKKANNLSSISYLSSNSTPPNQKFVIITSL